MEGVEKNANDPLLVDKGEGGSLKVDKRWGGRGRRGWIKKSLMWILLISKKWIREAIPKRNLFLFGFFPKGPVFLERFEELFKNLILY